MKKADLKKVYSPTPAAFHDALFTAAHAVEEEKIMKRKTWIWVLALVLVLACGTAFAIANHYSVRQYQGGGSPSEAFEKHITTLNQTYENEYVSLTLGDAVFDGYDIAMAMNLEAKNPEKRVFLYPKLTATCNGRALDLDIQGMRGDFASGFVFPNLQEDGLDGQYGFDATIYEDYADGDVTWDLTIQVLAPNYPIRDCEASLDGTDNDMSIEEYLGLFSSAYANGEILTTYGDSLVEYAEGLPIPEGMDEEDYYALRLNERLLLSGAFTLADTIACTFDTPMPEPLLQGVGRGLTFPMAEYTVDFLGMDVSFMRIAYAFDLVYPAGTTLETVEAGEQAYYVLQNENGETIDDSGASGQWIDAQPDGSYRVHWEGYWLYHDALPTEVRFVPFVYEGEGQVLDESKGFTVPVDGGDGE